MYDAPEGEPFADVDYEILSEWKVDNQTRAASKPIVSATRTFAKVTRWEGIESSGGTAICVGHAFSGHCVGSRKCNGQLSRVNLCTWIGGDLM